MFRFPARLPPGTYKIYGTKTEQGANPFVQLLQIQHSSVELVIAKHASEVEQNVAVPKP